MRIENEIELDYSDVLIKPRRSTIASRKDADITREYKFKWSGKTVKGTGIMQANMGTIGNFEVSRKMLNSGLFACLHKHHNVDDLVEFYRTLMDENDTYLRCLLAVGLKDNGVDKIREIKRQLGITVSVRLDVPNGYIPQIKQLVINMRSEFPDMIIFVGNVVTGDITEDLILNGADVVLCGIGGGSNCILGGTKVKTIDGYKKMRDICEGDLVQTHTGVYHKVLTKLCYNYHYEKININGIECTPEHKLYVVNKKDIDNITEDNYTEFAYWVEACNLDGETQMLIKINDINDPIDFVEIKKGNIVKNDEKVYDIEVESDHSFVVNDGIIAHNCLTRKQTGVGRPQLSAVIECADAAHQVGGMVCADGGITCPGDIGKAFGAGGDFVMIGGLYAGTDEAEGEILKMYYKNGEVTAEHDPVYTCKKFKEFYGMSSTLAQEKFGNGKPSYRASEGRVTLVPYVGSVDDVNEEILGGLRSTMTYLGAKRLKDIPKCCVFYRVNHQLNTIYENTTIGK